MIYITGDLHGEWDKRKAFIKSLKKEDILIVLGDLGWSWDTWHINNFHTECEVLSVLGNHENYTLIEQMPLMEKYGGRVRKMKDNVFYLMNGEMYEIEGKKYFVFGGALSIDKHWRKPYVSWWPQEQPTQSDFYNAVGNLERNNYTFDYFLTHTAETELVQTVLGTTDTVNDNTEKMIQQLKYLIKECGGSFDTHFFGHLHKFWKGEDDTGTWYCLYDQILDLYSNNIYFY